MSVTKKEPQYHPGKFRPLVQMIARLVQKNPGLADDPNYLMTQVIVSMPELADRTKCANCGTSMKVVEYIADLHDALLILAMARKVKENMTKGMTFTEANKIHMPTLAVNNTIIKRQTKCDYLGLLKQTDEMRGTGYWVLTKWAWEALQGKPIPRSAYYWQGEIQGRSVENITFGSMFRSHIELVQKSMAAGKPLRNDYREQIINYNPTEWANVYTLRENQLF